MPDVRPGGSTVGLIGAVERYFDRYFEARRKKGGETCKGEEICAVIGPLRDKSRPIEAICGGCELLPTKPGSMPQHIAGLIVQAHRMEALFEGGASTEYPNFYTPVEWEAFLTLKCARAKDQEKDFPKQNPSNSGQKSQAQLEAELQARKRKK
jgi:hypothetical protein